MNFITLSAKDMSNPAVYKQIKDKHIVISISGSEDKETIIPSNLSCEGVLHLKFDDVEDIQDRYIYFNRGMAKDVFDFVEKHCMQISTIIVQCQAGLSRSVGLASALSKILNGRDDNVFTRGVPNMFVYTTVLDEFFSNPKWDMDYFKISSVRNKQLSSFLSPAMVRLYSAKNRKRGNIK